MGKTSKGKPQVRATPQPPMQHEVTASGLHEPGVAKVSSQPTANEAWQRFAYELHVSLGGLEEDEFLIISAKHRPFYFVQFAAQGSFGMRAEASSNFYIPGEASITEDQHNYLLQLGWRAPTNLPDEFQRRHEPDGSANYYLDLANPVPYDQLALLATNSLRSVYGVSHPGELEYKAFSDNTSIRFPNLGIKHASPSVV